jgi:hypothetical protein
MVAVCWSHWYQLPEDVSALGCFGFLGKGDSQYLSRKVSSKLMPRKFPYTTFPVVTPLLGSDTFSACGVWRAEREETTRSDLKRERMKAIFAARWWWRRAKGVPSTGLAQLWIKRTRRDGIGEPAEWNRCQRPARHS